MIAVWPAFASQGLACGTRNACVVSDVQVDGGMPGR
jgi:hypothetical protein